VTGEARNETSAAAVPPGAAANDAGVQAGPGTYSPGLRVVYCGGCNPHIDRGAVASELAAAPAFVRPGGTVYLSGCERACASDHELSTDDPAAAIVAGSRVDGIPTPEPDIAASVRHKLKE
jgi:hypothetical protein